jgi:hypothetical protein
MGPRSRVLDVLWLTTAIVASTAWCITASARLSATFDEPTYVRLGLESWRSGTSRKLLDLGTLPLPVHLQTAPLHIWERCRGVPFDCEGDFSRLLPVARLGTLPFWWLLLVMAWSLGRRFAGPWGGRLAVLLVASEPNLLAHASLATTDVPVTAALIALFTHFSASRDHRWLSRVGGTAAWFALAVLTKASGVLFGGIGLLVIGVGSAARVARPLRAWLFARSLWSDLAQVFALGLALTFVYCGSDWSVSPSFVSWAHGLSEGPVKSVLVWLAEHLTVFSNAGVALIRQVRHNIQGHGVFLLDEVAPRAIWHYFPLALSMKAPVPLLLLPILVAVTQQRALANWACRVVVALLLFSLVCRVQTGIRLVLPLLALAAVGFGAAAVEAIRQSSAGRRRALLAATSIGAMWMTAAACQVWPHGLCYTNELWGGTRTGYLCLSDSNYDWGQGLKELAHWQKAHHLADLTVLYYGTDPTFSQLRMHRLDVLPPPGDDPTCVPPALQGRALAVGTSILYGSAREYPWVRPWATYLRHLQPVDRTTTFLIYTFPTEGPYESAVASRSEK